MLTRSCSKPNDTATSKSKNKPPFQPNKKIKVEIDAVHMKNEEKQKQLAPDRTQTVKKGKTKKTKIKPTPKPKPVENDPTVVKFVGLDQPQAEHATLHNVQVSSCGKWCDLGLDDRELHLARTLLSGMTFRWARVVSFFLQNNNLDKPH
jgi:hypothetical protein